MNNKARAIHSSNLGFKELQDRVVDALQGLKFGSVEIQIHDSRIVRITRTEKVRLAYPAEVETDRD